MRRPARIQLSSADTTPHGRTTYRTAVPTPRGRLESQTATGKRLQKCPQSTLWLDEAREARPGRTPKRCLVGSYKVPRTAADDEGSAPAFPKPPAAASARM